MALVCWVRNRFGAPQEAQLLLHSSDIMHVVKSKTGCSIELLDVDDPRAVLCPKSQRLLRVAGGRDQVGVRYLHARLVVVRDGFFVGEYAGATRVTAVRRKRAQCKARKGILIFWCFVELMRSNTLMQGV